MIQFCVYSLSKGACQYSCCLHWVDWCNMCSWSRFQISHQIFIIHILYSFGPSHPPYHLMKIRYEYVTPTENRASVDQWYSDQFDRIMFETVWKPISTRNKLQLKMQKGNIKQNINFYVIKTFSPQFQEFYKIVQKTTHA